MKKYYLLLFFLLSCSTDSEVIFQEKNKIVYEACEIGSVDELLNQYDCLIKGAELGNKIDQYNLSIYYLNYHIDGNKGIFWLTKSAEQDYAAAQYNLAVEFWKSKNLKQALYWAEKAKNNHFLAAYDILGLIYISKKEYFLAKMYLEKSAQLGNSNSMYNLGLLYENGTGVTKDLNIAISWYEQAANSGSIIAYVNLGVIYASEKKFYNPKKSNYYLRFAISNGDRLGEFALANFILREKLEGTFAEVESLLESSASKDCYPAAKLLEQLYSKQVSYSKFPIQMNMDKSRYFSNLANNIDSKTNDKTCNLNKPITF